MNIIENASTEKTFLSSLIHPYEGYTTTPDELFAGSYPDRILRAKAPLEKHGYSTENPIEISLAVYRDFNDFQVANAIVAMWAQIHVELEIVDLSDKRTDLNPNKDDIVDYKMTLIGSDYSDPSDFRYFVAIYGEFENTDRILKEVEATFGIKNKDKRWEALAEIDENFLRSRVSLPLASISNLWILSDDLEINEYFNLTAINLNSKTCKQDNCQISINLPTLE